MSRFFIDRPVFAWVMALLIMLSGVLCLNLLPVAQYPEIAPPSITIKANYPGASAQTVEDAVTQVIEQGMKGIDGLDYMASRSDASGKASVTLTFRSGTDPDLAQVQVQNKLQLVMSKLPQEVQSQGVNVVKSVSGFLTVQVFISNNGSMDASDLADYVEANVVDPISRVEGVGEVTVFGSQYGMRVWLNPDRLASFALTPTDVMNAIRAQNAQAAVGQLGALPATHDQGINVMVTSQTRMQRPEEFENILLRVLPDGSHVLLRDVARIELGQERYAMSARYNGQPTAALGISLATGANALATAEGVMAQIDAMRPYLPDGMEVINAYDTTPVVRLSVHEVVKTLLEAVALVFLVMLLFLQNVRATLIPTLAVPVVLLGTFTVLHLFGFTINTLTLFGLVLAIGLLVDDAIVVVENVERLMEEEGLSPKDATKKSMTEITGALVGIGTVLSAVFLPMAFFGGSTGVIYRQFSVTIVTAMAFSVLVAVTFTPSLCATLLREHKHDPEAHLAQGGFFGWFNRFFDRGTNRYVAMLAGPLRRPARLMLVFVGLIGIAGFLLMRMPTAYLPDEDQGAIFAMVQLPASATSAQTQDALNKMEHYLLTEEAETVKSVTSINGFSFSGAGQNMGMAFISLKDWSERTSPEQHAAALTARTQLAFSKIRAGTAYAFMPPAIVELGTSSGFVFELQDRAGLGREALINARETLLSQASQDPLLSRVRFNGMADAPQLIVSIDPHRAATMGLSTAAINADLGIAVGGAYVNDFMDRGRVKKVYVQADAPYRMSPEHLESMKFRNSTGEMVPFRAVADSSWISGPVQVERYNGFSSLEILGEPAPGISSGAAMQRMEELAAQLPEGIGFEWTGMSYQERLSGSQMPVLFGISILVIFLALAALYESWSVPFAVVLVVPLGILGAVVAASLRGLPNDIYFQVGILATVGLSAKNAILIVEFAKALHEQGMSLAKAALEAARLRLRPILMTSFAFGLGVLPLVVSTGAGSAAQHAVGTGVLGGTIAATALGIFFVPVFFVVVEAFAGRMKKGRIEAKSGEVKSGEALGGGSLDCGKL